MIRIGTDVNVWKYKGRKEVYENNKKKKRIFVETRQS